MQFVHQALTWGFLLTLLPVLIHLINLVRRRRVRWAAMDFLLQSYRKHRTWIWLQQFLLLLLRMAAVALIVAMLAQWVTQREWFAIFGGTATHHYVLLDDSFSMGERVGGTSAFDRAEEAIQRLAAESIQQETRHKVTLLRLSRAAGADESTPAGQVTDLNAEIVDANFDVLLSDRVRDFQPTELAVGPRAALDVVRQLLDEGQEEKNLVYLLSDFRQKDWSNPAEVRQQLRALVRNGAEVHLVHCVDRPQDNLAVTAVQPAEDTRAAGVPLFVDIQVRNFGRQTVRKVPVRVRTYFFDPQRTATSRPGEDVSRADDPPAALIEEILPGATAAARVQVYFPQPGAHLVEVWLPDDALMADNRRWCVVDLAESEQVLVVDGSTDQRHAYYVESAFAPGQRASTGIRPDRRQASFLRNATPEILSAYRAIYLLDVPRLDPAALENLTDYVAQGGGLAIFLGENALLSFYNGDFYQEGSGLFPLPLGRDAELSPERFEDVPDLQVTDHPIFSVFLGERNPFIRLVRIDRYVRPAEAWTPGPRTAVTVLARLRNGDPLAVERRFGEGRVIALLTTAAPQWNNWGLDPSFVVMLLKTQSYLAAPLRRSETRLVGSPLEIELDAERFAPEVSFVLPASAGPSRPVTEATAERPQPSAGVLVARLGEEELLATGKSGAYEAWLQALAGPPEVRRFAFNVDPAEGDLACETTSALVERLEPVQVETHSAGDFAYDFLSDTGANRSLLVMTLLLATLFGEQWLAYLTSYHPLQGSAR